MKASISKRFLKIILVAIFCFVTTRVYAEGAKKAAPAKSHASSKSAPKKKSDASHRDKKSEQIKKMRAPKAHSDDAHGAEGGHEVEKSRMSAVEIPIRQPGIDAILVVDSSRSMKKTDPLRLRDQGAKLFLRFLSEDDRIAVVQFDSETKVLLPLTRVNAELIKEIDKILDNIQAEGNFTDLWTSVDKALEHMKEQGRHGAQKTVILLSDGQMDPHPKVGQREELIKKLKEETLEDYKNLKIKLYTLALSEFSDKDLLAEMAKQTSGLSWYAPNVNAVHHIFSELFLEMKRPQISVAEPGGFEIDRSVSDVTFYINHQEDEENIVISDPNGKRYSSSDFPPGMKWYRGSLFDLVTVNKPTPGRWAVAGAKEVEGFAKLLSSLELFIDLPHADEHAGGFREGDVVKFSARLVNEGKELDETGISDVTFYTYKVANSENGKIIAEGVLERSKETKENYDAHEHSKHSGEYQKEITQNHHSNQSRRYVGEIKMPRAGEYRLIVAAVGPTFNRQSAISFAVIEGLVEISLSDSEHGGAEEGIIISPTEAGKELTGKIFELVIAKNGGHTKSVSLEKYKTHDGSFFVPFSDFAKGEYEAYAKLTGVNSKKEKISRNSEEISFEVSRGEEGASSSEEENMETAIGEDESVIEARKQAKKDKEKKFGLFGIGFAVFWILVVSFFAFKKFFSGFSRSEIQAPEAISDEIKKSAEEIISRSSNKLRAPTEEEKELFKNAGVAYTEISTTPDTSEAEESKEESLEHKTEETSSEVKPESNTENLEKTEGKKEDSKE